MENNNCIFCKIANGEIGAVKIWENENFFAILDNKPNTKGMTLVMPKAHYESYAFDMPEDVYCELQKATREVAKILEKGLGVMRVAMVMEGMGVNHTHIKLYPMYGLSEKFSADWAEDRIYFEKYDGYISTKLGPDATMEELEKVAREIMENNK